MNNVHFRTLDLNLLRVFVALLDEGSVTRAADRLGLTQSAVSHALNRLRYVMGDALFVRGRAGMQPTPRAGEIAPRVREGLAQLQSALAPADFTPAETDRRFTLAASPYACAVLLPEVIARVRSEAPNAELHVRNPMGAAVETVDLGRTDILIGSFGRIPERFGWEPLFLERLVWVLREDHPMADRPLTLETLAALPQVITASAEAEDTAQGSVMDQGLERKVVIDDGVLQDALAERGLRRTVALTVPDIHSALAVVSQSDMAALAPRRLVRVFAKALRLKPMEAPYSTASTELMALWRKDNDDPAVRWMRGLLREAGAGLRREGDLNG